MKTLVLSVLSAVASTLFASTLAAIPLQTTFHGAESWDGIGWCVAVGDFNGDGRKDFVVDATHYPIDKFTFVWGQAATFPVSVDLASPSVDASTIVLPIGYAGMTDFVVGDFNDDEFDDLLLWMHESDYDFTTRAYVVFGAPAFPENSEFLDGTVTVTTLYVPDFDDCSLAIAAGDVDGDGTDDIIVAAPCQGASGTIHVVYGRESFPPSMTLPDATTATIVETRPAWRTGSAITTADVDSDGKSDLLFAAFQNEEPYFTRATLVWGANLAPGQTFSLYRHQPDAVTFRAGTSVAGFPAALALGDVNGDSHTDVVITAHTDESAGAAYVVHGGVDWDDIVFVDNRTFPVTTIRGVPNGTQYGYRVQCADVNGDVLDDVILGASHGVGSVAIVAGMASLPSEISIGSVALNWILTTPQPGNWYGLELELEDVNGDAIDDILVTAIFHNSLGRSSNGAVFVYGGLNATGVGDSRIAPPFGGVTTFPNPFSTDVTITVGGISDALMSSMYEDDWSLLSSWKGRVGDRSRIGTEQTLPVTGSLRECISRGPRVSDHGLPDFC